MLSLSSVGSAVIHKVCATILPNLVFMLLLSVPGFVAEAGSGGRVKAVHFCKMHSKPQNLAEALSY